MADRPPGAVSLFLAVDGEVDLRPLGVELRSRGWTTALPVVGADRSMTFRRWTDDTAFGRSVLGVPEPIDGDEIPVADLQVLVVPAVAVDRKGNRLGFGAGYYDRALARRSPDALLVGAVHSVQVVDAIEPDPWDVALDVVVTELGPTWAAGEGSGGP